MTSASGSPAQVWSLGRDGSGHVTHVDAVDTGGAPTASTLRRYSAFGVPGEAAPAQSIERGFASRPIEGASGLVYMRARHYDPTTGRFLQPDPEGIASTQRYAFAEHNPYVYNDPTGRASRGIGSLDRGVPSWAFEGGDLLANNSGGPFMLNDGPTLQTQTMMNAMGSANVSQGGTTVELLYTETPIAGAYHAFALVTGPDAEQYYARGGTLARTEGAGLPNFLGGEGIFKTIDAQYGSYQPGTVDYTTEPVARQTVLRSGDPGAYGKFTGILRDFANGVNTDGIPYRPFTQNSNSFAFTAVGLLPGATVPMPQVYAPGYDTILRRGR